MDVEIIKHQTETLAIFISNKFKKDGISFFTPDDFSQQVGYMKREVGYEILPHVHNPVLREVTLTQEVLIIKSGKVRVDFYTQEKTYLFSKIIIEGDVILLAAGGHGFIMLEESEIIEVKQGPYCGELDKTRFNSISNEPEKITFYT
jgi:hypothetical protein